jgi:broad specificity phosphatase PhoE
MEAVHVRTSAWLDTMTARDGAFLAITHPMIMRALLAHALQLPLASTLAIDIAPLSAARLSFNRRWRLQSLGPIMSNF